MINKISVWLAFLALVIGLLGLWYVDYEVSSPCMELKSLQNNKDRSIKFKNELFNYVKSDQIHSELTKKVGGVFDIFEFSTPLELFISDDELKKKTQKILIKNNRLDYKYTEPYEILEVGVGYGRSYITFKNNKKQVLVCIVCQKKVKEMSFLKTLFQRKNGKDVREY